MSTLVPAQSEVLPAVAAIEPGSRPLRRPAHERFARARVLMLPLVEAYRQAMREDRERRGEPEPDYVIDRGNAAKLDRRRDVRDRVAFLTRQDEDVLKAKRARLEGFLWAAHETDYTEYFEPGSNSRLRPFSELTTEQKRMIESLKWTEKGRPILSVYTRSWANIELRKMLGIGPQVREPGDGEFSRLDDASLFAEIAREAKELGVDVELTFRANGASASP